MDVFLSVLPSHYMVSDEAVARFKESHRIAWLKEQLSLGDSESAESPIFKATAGPMPTEMQLVAKTQHTGGQEDATNANATDVGGAGDTSSSTAVETDPTGATVGSLAARNQDDQEGDDDSRVKSVVESMVSTTAANETMPSPAMDSSDASALAGLAAPASTASTTAGPSIGVGVAFQAALTNTQGAKRSREEGGEAGDDDGGEEADAKRMREGGPSSGDAGDAGDASS